MEVNNTAGSVLKEAQRLIAAGEATGADSLLQSAIQSFPDNLALLQSYAAIASEREDWAEAAKRWAAVKAASPEDWVEDWIAGHRLFEAKSRLVDSGTVFAEEIPSLGAHTARDRDLMMSFEGLGGHFQGCEFGNIQRWHGAEPLGLLRWTGMTHQSLLDALEARFEGVGLPENTELYTEDNDGYLEYRTRDRRFIMAMHTFVRADSIPYDSMLRNVCRRLQYLRDKLVFDLTAGEKIFVFRVTTGNLSGADVASLRHAMRRYGRNTLLYVKLADEQHPGGTVVQLEPGLLIGYIELFEAQPQGEAARLWTPICRRAYELFRESL
jgi:hypothetical protein